MEISKATSQHEPPTFCSRSGWHEPWSRWALARPKAHFTSRRALLAALGCLACALASACATGGEEAQGPEDVDPASLTEGQRCLRDAAAPRTPLPNAPERIGVSHILVRHQELDDPKGATRSREQACLTALEALKALQSGAGWDESVEKYSDSGKTMGGSLGEVSRDQLSPSFGDAAFALQVNELSYVVESDRGYHVILRTD